MVLVNLSEDTAAVLEGEVLRLSGQVTSDVVSRVYDQGLKKLSSPVTEVDCHSLKGADSTCLALLLHLQSRLSERLKVVGLPEELRVLVNLYGLQDLFELA